MAAEVWGRFCNSLFGINGVILSIGVLGFLSSIATLFVDIDSQISVRWILLLALVSLIVIVVLLGLLGQPSMNTAPPLFEVPIKFLHSEGLLIIKRNENFTNTIIVGCYVREGDVERLAFVAAVEHTQEKCIQLRIVHDTGCINEPEKAKLRDLVVKPFIPAMVLDVMRGL